MTTTESTVTEDYSVWRAYLADCRTELDRLEAELVTMREKHGYSSPEADAVWKACRAIEAEMVMSHLQSYPSRPRKSEAA